MERVRDRRRGFQIAKPLTGAKRSKALLEKGMAPWRIDSRYRKNRTVAETNKPLAAAMGTIRRRKSFCLRRSRPRTAQGAYNSELADPDVFGCRPFSCSGASGKPLMMVRLEPVMTRRAETRLVEHCKAHGCPEPVFRATAAEYSDRGAAASGDLDRSALWQRRDRSPRRRTVVASRGLAGGRRLGMGGSHPERRGRPSRRPGHSTSSL
jgi:hypothetical protein